LHFAKQVLHSDLLRAPCYWLLQFKEMRKPKQRMSCQNSVSGMGLARLQIEPVPAHLGGCTKKAGFSVDFLDPGQTSDWKTKA
jgi:hypothetical protein